MAVGGVLAVAGIAYVAGENARQQEERRERLRLVATITSVPTYCPDDRQPFYITIRNIAGRTAVAARFQFWQDPLPAGTLPSDIPAVSLDAPLPPGQAVSKCYALNRLQLVARGIDPRSLHFSPILDSVCFE